MKKPTFKEISELFSGAVLPFYDVKRDMYVPLKERRVENDAEHSWAVALVSCSLAERIAPGLDIGNVAQLALVHDLVEIFAGDTSVWNKGLKQTKAEREKKALGIIKRKFATFPWLIEKIDEYEIRSSPESRFVRAVDKYVAISVRLLDVRVGNMPYKDEIPLTKSQYIEGLATARRKAHGYEGVGEYFDEVYKIFLSHPEWFVEE